MVVLKILLQVRDVSFHYTVKIPTESGQGNMENIISYIQSRSHL